MTSTENGRTFGPIFTSSNICRVNPPGIGNADGMMRDQPRDVGVRLFDRHAGLEPRHALIAEVADEELRAVEAEGEDELRVLIEKAEARRQHADDLARLAVDHDRRPTTAGSPPNLRCQ